MNHEIVLFEIQIYSTPEKAYRNCIWICTAPPFIQIIAHSFQTIGGLLLMFSTRIILSSHYSTFPVKWLAWIQTISILHSSFHLYPMVWSGMISLVVKRINGYSSPSSGSEHIEILFNIFRLIRTCCIFFFRSTEFDFVFQNNFIFVVRYFFFRPSAEKNKNKIVLTDFCSFFLSFSYRVDKQCLNAVKIMDRDSW